MKNNMENNTENNMKNDKELKPRKCEIGPDNLKILYKNLNKYFLMYRDAYCKEMNKEKVTKDEIHTSIAEKVGVNPYSVGRWEDNFCPPSLDNIISLTKVFNCTIDDLLTEKNTDVEKPSTLQSEDLSAEETQVKESEEVVVVEAESEEVAELQTESTEVEVKTESTTNEISQKKTCIEKTLNEMIEKSNSFLSKLDSNSVELLKEFGIFSNEDLENFKYIIRDFRIKFIAYINNYHLAKTHNDYINSTYKLRKEKFLSTSNTMYNRFIKRLPKRIKELIENENECIGDAYNFYISIYMVLRTLEYYNKYEKSKN